MKSRGNRRSVVWCCYGRTGRSILHRIANPYTYTGRRLDDETGLFYYRNRYYHAQLGRFVTRDPIGYEGSQWNLYEYVAGNPVRNLDPAGLMWFPPQGDWPPSAPKDDARYTPGFKLCRRDIQGGNCCDSIAASVGNCCGGSHTYLQYGPVDEKGNPASWTEGWGIGGGNAGTLPQSEKHFAPDSCSALTKGNCTLRFGKSAGKLGSQASDAEIKECLGKVPMSKSYSMIKYNCKHWAREAAAACGLCDL